MGQVDSHFLLSLLAYFPILGNSMAMYGQCQYQMQNTNTGYWNLTVKQWDLPRDEKFVHRICP